MRLEPVSAHAYFSLGCVLHDPETLAEAIGAYQKSLELAPGQVEVTANLGEAFLQLGQFEEAREVLVRAEKINPTNPKLHHLLGEVYLKLGMRDQAVHEHNVLRKISDSLAAELAESLDKPS